MTMSLENPHSNTQEVRADGASGNGGSEGSMVGDMSLRSECEKLQALLDQLGQSRWAESVCVASRLVHVAAWQDRPSKKLADQLAIPLLRKAREAVAEWSNAHEGAVDYIVGNIDTRIDSLERYVGGLPARITPDDRLERWQPDPLLALSKGDPGGQAVPEP